MAVPLAYGCHPSVLPVRCRPSKDHNVPAAAPLLETRLNGLAPHRQGKVRDIFDLGDALLMVATDRISAFDYVLGSGIPDKGKVLTQLSAFWFEQTADLVPNHLLTMEVSAYPADLRRHADVLAGRSMLVKKTNPVPIECVARGYLSGSGWKEYTATGSVCGIALPPGLREADRLPQPIFTPATKATGGRGRSVSEAEAGRHVGDGLVRTLRDLTLALYRRGAARAASRGIILADTKFEFGVTSTGDVILIDEVMNPDSSRDCPEGQYRPAGPQPTFATRCVRGYLQEIRWNKQ